jgi:hypothetical protein
MSMLNDIHGLISGIKALFTQVTYDGLETTRQTCGGAGFSLHAGIAHKV